MADIGLLQHELRLGSIRTSTVPAVNQPGMNDGNQNNIMKLAEAAAVGILE